MKRSSGAVRRPAAAVLVILLALAAAGGMLLLSSHAVLSSTHLSSAAHRHNRRSLQDLDTAQPVRLHGLLSKEGPLLSLAALAAHSGGAPDPLFPADWLERRLLGKASHPQVPACTLAVNHKYKIIYAKVGRAHR